MLYETIVFFSDDNREEAEWGQMLKELQGMTLSSGNVLNRFRFYLGVWHSG